MSRGFPGYRVENYVNAVCNRFDQIPSAMAVKLFTSCTALSLMLLCLQINHTANTDAPDLIRAMQRVFSPLVFVMGFQGNWIILRKYPMELFKPVYKLVWITFLLILISGQMGLMFFLSRDTYLGITSISVNFLVLSTFLSYHLRQVSVGFEQEDRKVIENGKLPTQRFFFRKPLFIYACFSSAFFALSLYMNASKHLYTVNIYILMHSLLLIISLINLMAILALSCLPRPPITRKKISFKWFDNLLPQG